MDSLENNLQPGEGFDCKEMNGLAEDFVKIWSDCGANPEICVFGKRVRRRAYVVEMMRELIKSTGKIANISELDENPNNKGVYYINLDDSIQCMSRQKYIPHRDS